MTLLAEVMEHPLDPSYAEAAARRTGPGKSRAGRGPISWLALALVSILLGLGTVTAAEALRVPTPVMREARALLEGEIADRNSQIAVATWRRNELNAEIAVLQDDALAQLNGDYARLINTDSLNNGSAAVIGPGLVITLSDGGGPLAEENPESLVRDADLQRVIGYLWAAGAEAIAVDDQRLTMTSAVRNAGDAILVDLIPLSGPTYTIRAIGSPEQMHAAWADSEGPVYLQLLGEQYGIRSATALEPYLELPSATSKSLRFAAAIISEP